MAFKQEIGEIDPRHTKFIRMFQDGLIKLVYITPPECVGEAYKSNEVYADAGVAEMKKSIDDLVVALLDGQHKVKYSVNLEYSTSLSNIVRSMDLAIETSGSSPVCMNIRISSKSLK